ncbi:hypothetical protein AWV80_03225 [Cupriavidus sp. UYMU48A]|nr:hypothetical protein AWV80_03225 [Cupriavidus sp. UYMU48A]
MKNSPEEPVEKERILRKTLSPGVTKVLKRLHFPVDVILLCVRWYVAYSLSLRNLEEMMVERGIEVDHSSVHRWEMHGEVMAGIAISGYGHSCPRVAVMAG